MDRAIINDYEAGGTKLQQAIRGLTRDDLLLVPAEEVFAKVGRWSIQQVVVHLMDADLIWTGRMKCIIAEENPTIIGYDESRFAAGLFCERQDAELAVQIFDLNRRQFAKVLRALPDAAFARTGNHNERGTITLEGSVRDMIRHVDHHVGFIHAKRAATGKEMW